MIDKINKKKRRSQGKRVIAKLLVYFCFVDFVAETKPERDETTGSKMLLNARVWPTVWLKGTTRHTTLATST